MISSSLIIRTFLVAWRSGAGLRPDNNVLLLCTRVSGGTRPLSRVGCLVVNYVIVNYLALYKV